MEIREELVQAILNYLARQPYTEVYQLIGELIKAQQEHLDLMVLLHIRQMVETQE